MNILKKHYKKVLICIAIAYVVSVFISQQKMLNSYNSEIKYYEAKKEEEEEKNEELVKMKENVNSSEYIEQIARDKLGMYLPNERVYIDIGK